MTVAVITPPAPRPEALTAHTFGLSVVREFPQPVAASCLPRARLVTTSRRQGADARDTWSHRPVTSPGSVRIRDPWSAGGARRRSSVELGGPDRAPCWRCWPCTPISRSAQNASRSRCGARTRRPCDQDGPGLRRAAAQGARRPGRAGHDAGGLLPAGRPGELDAERFERSSPPAARRSRPAARRPPPATRGTGPVARPAARRARLCAVRARRDRAPGGAAPRGAGGPDRGRPRGRATRRADRRTPALCGQHPWRERLHAQLMSRSIAAAARPTRSRPPPRPRGARRPAGIEPGAELRDLHQAILAHDAALDALPATGDRPSGGAQPQVAGASESHDRSRARTRGARSAPAQAHRSGC